MLPIIHWPFLNVHRNNTPTPLSPKYVGNLNLVKFPFLNAWAFTIFCLILYLRFFCSIMFRYLGRIILFLYLNLMYFPWGMNCIILNGLIMMNNLICFMVAGVRVLGSGEKGLKRANYFKDLLSLVREKIVMSKVGLYRRFIMKFKF